MLNQIVDDVTARLVARSADTRAAYLERVADAAQLRPSRAGLGCANLAHGFAAAEPVQKQDLRTLVKPNVAIVSAYNDMLSAHKPFETYPALLKQAVIAAGGLAQFAGGVPAMCDGITQGRAGMELSLFSRDVIAMSTAIALSHEMFDAALLLGVCDKIVPGLLIGALSFGHLPAVFVPAGPMTSGLPNSEKAKVREQYAQGLVDRGTLLEAEAASYHGVGTCTFYGTANSNQLLMEVMGLHLPGASFVNPGTELRDALTAEAARQVLELTTVRGNYTPVGHIVDEKAVINGAVALLATGGSTNHTMHLVAIARAAGIQLTWDDLDDLSRVVPLLARIYPNGSADVNHFHAAGGIAFLVRELLDSGLLHEDVRTVAGPGLRRYLEEPVLVDTKLTWHDGPSRTHDAEVLRPVSYPFSPDGGLRVLRGNLGRGVIKVSAVAPKHRIVSAPARVFDGQQEFLDTYRTGNLDRDFVAVIRYQGPSANGMPELHSLSPALGALQERGFRVALVTDGRLSGASGKVPAAIQVTPEAAIGGPLAKIRDGDVVTVDGNAGTLVVHVSTVELDRRAVTGRPPSTEEWTGTGRELFTNLRAAVGPADQGASALLPALIDDRPTPDAEAVA
jgi:phosphogluconate dehydratase